MADAELERELVRKRLLGWSLACDPVLPGVDIGRDLVLAGGDGEPLDLARVEGIECLGQSLTLALTTALGSDLFNTEFGFDGIAALAEETNAILARERVRVAVVKLLQKEPRVRRIIDVDLGDERLRPPPGGRVLDVAVGFQTVSHDQVSVNLGRVVQGV